MSVQDVIAEAQSWPDPTGVFLVVGGSHGLGAQIADAIEAADGKAVVLDTGGPRHPGVSFFEADFSSDASIQQSVNLVLKDLATFDGVVAVVSSDNELRAVASVARAAMQTLSKVDGKVLIISKGISGAETVAKRIALESNNEVRAEILDANVIADVGHDVIEALTH